MIDVRMAVRKWSVGNVVLLMVALSFWPLVAKKLRKAHGTGLPGCRGMSSGRDCGLMASWDHQDVKYCVYEYRWGSSRWYII